MKFSTPLLAIGLILGASAAYAGADDGTADNVGFIQAVAGQVTASQPAPAAATDNTAKAADSHNQFEDQIPQP